MLIHNRHQPCDGMSAQVHAHTNNSSSTSSISRPRHRTTLVVGGRLKLELVRQRMYLEPVQSDTHIGIASIISIAMEVIKMTLSQDTVQ